MSRALTVLCALALLLSEGVSGARHNRRVGTNAPASSTHLHPAGSSPLSSDTNEDLVPLTGGAADGLVVEAATPYDEDVSRGAAAASRFVGGPQAASQSVAGLQNPPAMAVPESLKPGSGKPSFTHPRIVAKLDGPGSFKAEVPKKHQLPSPASPSSSDIALDVRKSTSTDPKSGQKTSTTVTKLAVHGKAADEVASSVLKEHSHTIAASSRVSKQLL